MRPAYHLASAALCNKAFSDYRYLVVPYVSKCFGEFGVLVSEERVRARHKTYIDRLSASLDRGVAKLNEHNRIREAYDAALAMDSLYKGFPTNASNTSA